MSRLPILYYAGLGPIGTAIAFYVLSLVPTLVVMTRLYLRMADTNKNREQWPIVEELLIFAMHWYTAPLSYIAELPGGSDLVHGLWNYSLSQ